MISPPMPLRWPPVVSILGNSDSGKTVLIERLVPRLRARGLRVAVVKHCSHGVDVDHPGKDSDRIFKSGADVLAVGPGESFLRLHSGVTPDSWWLHRVPETCHVILLEGFRETAFPKIRLVGKYGVAEDRGAEDTLLVLADAEQGCDAAEKAVWDIVVRSHAALPTYAAVLVGPHGAQPRDGAAGRGADRALEHVVAAATPHVRQVLLVGPEPFSLGMPDMPRLPAAPDVPHPLAGVLSAIRWQPKARWLVLGCNNSPANPSTVEWLLAQVSVGLDAIMPAPSGCADEDRGFAVLEPTVRTLLERAAAQGQTTLPGALSAARVLSPEMPVSLSSVLIAGRTKAS